MESYVCPIRPDYIQMWEWYECIWCGEWDFEMRPLIPRRDVLWDMCGDCHELYWAGGRPPYPSYWDRRHSLVTHVCKNLPDTVKSNITDFLADKLLP